MKTFKTLDNAVRFLKLWIEGDFGKGETLDQFIREDVTEMKAMDKASHPSYDKWDMCIIVKSNGTSHTILGITQAYQLIKHVENECSYQYLIMVTGDKAKKEYQVWLHWSERDGGSKL